MLGKRLLNLKGSKLGQILRADKTGFCRLGHKLNFSYYTKHYQKWMTALLENILNAYEQRILLNLLAMPVSMTLQETVRKLQDF